VTPGATVVVGDGAVGLLGVLSAKQMGAERIIAMSRHASRQALAREFGATDIVTERGDNGSFFTRALAAKESPPRAWDWRPRGRSRRPVRRSYWLMSAKQPSARRHST
jgi:NADPH:quinone reductase-like Zn-dependent oxidoreductase